MARVVETIMTAYADRPALGRRAREVVVDEETGRRAARLLPSFETITFREVWSRTTSLASVWRHDPRFGVAPGDFVATLGFSSIDYAVIELALIHVGAVSVPLQKSAPPTQWTTIMGEVEPTVLAVSLDLVDAALESIRATPSLDRIVVFDVDEEVDDHRSVLEEIRRALAGRELLVETLGEAIAAGRELPVVPVHEAAEGEDPLGLVIYTSGSTGTPKGAMHNESVLRRSWSREDTAWGATPMPVISLNYAPMSHLNGRLSVFMSLALGGIGYFAGSNDMSTLFDDLALSRCTTLSLVPRICDMIFTRYQFDVERRLAEAPGADPAEIVRLARDDVRDRVLGGRALAVMVSSAPVSHEVKEFIDDCLGFEAIYEYGSTEAWTVLSNGVVKRPPVQDYRLLDVPELGYLSTDVPHPRGELLVRTRSIFAGYLKRPDVTAAVLDDEGYYRTGDIAEEIGPDHLRIIDRRNNVLKLAQGEFVAISALESLYVASPVVHQIYVHGNSERSFLLAVVVPTPEAVAAAAGDVAALKSSIMESLHAIAREEGLQAYEVPRDLLVEAEAFSAANGLLTGVAKLARPNLKTRYGAALDELYANLDDQSSAALRSLAEVDPDAPAVAAVVKVAQFVLGLPPADISPQASFKDLGGDSLAAMEFSVRLAELFDIDVPVSVITSAANDLEGVAGFIDRQRGSDVDRPTPEAVHGTGYTEVRAEDLKLDRFLDEALLSAAPTLPRTAGPPRTVLLTGANGYLGHLLALVLLERVELTGGRLVVIIRGRDAKDAYQRLEQAFDTGDAGLLDRFRTLAARHLEVCVGDVAEPRLGLSVDDWQRLAETVDHVCHPAAQVNHVLPYGQLFGPNVVGTAEIIRLALTSRVKPVSYLSTDAVAISMDRERLDEDTDIRVLSAVRPIDDAYAGGYGNSKWAGEVLLREAHDLCGLPVAVFRSDMILAHSGYRGQLNVPDQFTRLILSLVATGLAPRSFYQGEGSQAHYDGLPGDFTAEAIATLALDLTSGFHTFNCANPHADGIGLDAFVDWLIESGQEIRRVDDYAEWFHSFEAALRALPADRQRHSLLPLLHAFVEPAPARNGSSLPVVRFQQAVRGGAVGGYDDIPHLSKGLIVKYADDLRCLGLL